MEPMTRIELVTSPLPRECSTTELHGQASLNKTLNASSFFSIQSYCFRHTKNTGAGEGNRTLIVSLEGFCSTIELHPHYLRIMYVAITARTSSHINSPNNLYGSHYSSIHSTWWRGKDSNLRRQSRQIYSLIPLTAREPLQAKLRIMNILPL